MGLCDPKNTQVIIFAKMYYPLLIVFIMIVIGKYITTTKIIKDI